MSVNTDGLLSLLRNAAPRTCISTFPDRSFLFKEWKKLSAVDSWFEEIWKRHCEAQRHYHTTVHLMEMLQYLNIIEQETTLSARDASAIRLAIFFHDIVYNPKSAAANEIDSERIFRNFATDVGLDTDMQNTVSDYILTTQNHKVSSDHAYAMALFLDLDMAVLAKSSDAYMQYAAQIRQEYSFVPQQDYCEKRADILESFLQQPKIFGTDIGEVLWNEPARSNVEAEIALLRGGNIPGQDEG